MFPAILQSIQVKLHCGILPVTQAIWIRESGNQYNGILNPHCGIQNPRLSWIPLHWLILCIASRFTGTCCSNSSVSRAACAVIRSLRQKALTSQLWSFAIHSLISGKRKRALIFARKVIFERLYYSRTEPLLTDAYPKRPSLYSCHPLGGQSIHWILFKGAVSRNSAKLGNYKMPVKFRETLKQPLKTLKEG